MHSSGSDIAIDCSIQSRSSSLFLWAIYIALVQSNVYNWCYQTTLRLSCNPFALPHCWSLPIARALNAVWNAVHRSYTIACRQNPESSVLGRWMSFKVWCVFSKSLQRSWWICTLVQVYDVAKALSPVTFPGYNKLTKTQKVEWNNRYVSVHVLKAVRFKTSAISCEVVALSKFVWTYW